MVKCILCEVTIKISLHITHMLYVNECIAYTIAWTWCVYSNYIYVSICVELDNHQEKSTNTLVCSKLTNYFDGLKFTGKKEDILFNLN